MIDKIHKDNSHNSPFSEKENSLAMKSNGDFHPLDSTIRNSRTPVKPSDSPNSNGHHPRGGVLCLILCVLVILLFAANIFYGSVSIPFSQVMEILTGQGDATSPMTFIVIDSRLPQAATALLAGAGLAVAGLMLQTAFHNPLAGPSILGITSGAGLGVALVMLLLGGTLGTGAFMFSGYLAIVMAAFIGSIMVMGFLLAFSSLLKNNLLLLITGIMLGYITSSAISLLNFTANEDAVHSYIIWGMGSFSGVTLSQLPYFTILTLIGISIALLLIKPLNVMLLGNQYAENLGINLRNVRNKLLLATGLLTAVITAFCGPVAFIGLAVPHIARLLLRSNNHRSLMPLTLLIGGALALFCNLLCILPNNTVIPLNAITPLFGAPVILYVISTHNKKSF